MPISVSVCIPVLNGASFLAESVRSTLDQKGIELQLVIVNNGSTDSSAEVARQFLCDERVQYIHHQEALGMGMDWNRSVDYARHDFVKVLPCDDILLPGSLAREADALQSDPTLSFVASPRRLMTRSGRQVATMRPVSCGQLGESDLQRMLLRSARNPIGEPGAVTFRKEAFLNCGGFDNSLLYYCDADCWLRLSRSGPGLMLHCAGSSFRAHGASLTVKNRLALYDDCIRFRKKHHVKSSPVSLLKLRTTTTVRQWIVALANRF